MRRHGRQPGVNRIPGQQFGLNLALKKQNRPEPEETDEETAPDCICDVTGVRWNNPSTGVFDTTSRTIDLSNLPTAANYPRAALVGDTCPGADLSGITTSWSSENSLVNPHTFIVCRVDQVWALVFTKFVVTSSGLGTMTVTGSIDCGGEPISVGPITITFTNTGGGDTQGGS